MTDPAWRILTELAEPPAAGQATQLMQGLAAAAAELDLSPAFLERLQMAIAAAARKAGQRYAGRADAVSLALRVWVPAGEQAQSSWGFFLLERAGNDAARHSIELFLYRDGR
jgi:hypothetical protein